jgi:hypothetical protein
MYCVEEASEKCTVSIKVEVWSDDLTTANIYQCGVHHRQPPASFLSASDIQRNLAQTIAQEYGTTPSVFLRRVAQFREKHKDEAGNPTHGIPEHRFLTQQQVKSQLALSQVDHN